MKKENKWLLINTGIVLLLSALFVILYAFVIPVSNYDKVFGTKVKLSNAEVIEETPDEAPYAIISKKEVATKGSKVIGDIYTLLVANDYGKIELLVGFDANGKVSVSHVVIDQTYPDIENLNSLILKQINDFYKDVTIDGLLSFNKNISIEAFDTTASVSTGTILNLLKKTARKHQGLLFQDVFGEEYSPVVDEEFQGTEIVIKKEDVFVDNEIIGQIYTLYASGEYRKGSGPADIKMLIAIKDGEIKGYEFEVYEHTPGYDISAIGFIEQYLGTKLNDYPNHSGEELVTGATFSTTLLDSMIRDLRDVLGGGE